MPLVPLADFTVVMPAHILTQEHLRLTENAVKSFEGPELIVIDDASPQGGGYLRSIADIYIRNKENLGYAKSVNRGLRMAKTKYIAVANNDIRVSHNWMDVADEVFRGDENCYSCHFRMTDYDVPFEFGNTILYEGKERWCHASFFVINKSKALFYYDEEYFNTYDDWDYFHMVRSAGLKQCYTDRAQFQHIHSATIPHMPKHNERNLANREYFKNKWGDYAEALFRKQFPKQMLTYYPDGFKL